MPIDFDNLPVLSSPARVQRFKEIALRERQQANAIKAKGKKKHSVNRERSREDSDRAKKVVAASKEKLTRAKAYVQLVRAYWRGEIDEHPTWGG